MLDDILSALDVHTSRWIVNECFAGELLRGRTILLVTHNVLLASSIAGYIVALNSDGTVRSQGPVENVLKDDTALLVAAKEKAEEMQKVESAEVTEESDLMTQKGKLIVAEEVAIGHIGWSTCAFSDLYTTFRTQS